MSTSTPKSCILSAFVLFFATTVSFSCPTPGLEAADLECVISESTLQRFVESAFPMQLKGTANIGIAGIGAAVPWIADVKNPKITITKMSQTLQADVDAVSNGLNIETIVKGDLSIAYDKEKKAVVVNLENALALIRIAPTQIQLDMSDAIVDLPFELSLPEYTVNFQDKAIRVTTEPEISFANKKIIIDGDINFEVTSDDQTP